MTYREIQPVASLRPYVKSIYQYEAADARDFDDIVFPSGNMELIFNLGPGQWMFSAGSRFVQTAPVELWGQITRPMHVRSKGKNVMLGVKFYVHTASLFLHESAVSLNNNVWNASDILGRPVLDLHERLLASGDFEKLTGALQHYLLERLSDAVVADSKIQLVTSIVRSLDGDEEPETIGSLSKKNKISVRYLNHLFSQYTGLTPKLLHKINRFQRSLSKVNLESSDSLTSIGYDTGYFDQSHFIRDFKSFTGMTPTAFREKSLPINQMITAAST